MIAGAAVLALVLTDASAAVAGPRPDGGPDASVRRPLATATAPQPGAAAAGPTPAAKAAPGRHFLQAADGLGCNSTLPTGIVEIPDEDGGVSAQINYSGTIECTPGVYFEGEAYLVDRTPGFDGVLLGQARTIAGFDRGTSAASRVLSADEPGGEDVETVFAADIDAPFLWDGCQDRPGVRVLVCEGVGTTHLTVVVGSGKYKSKKRRKPACQNRQHTFLYFSRTKKGSLVADPSGAYDYCVSPTGDVTSATLVGVTPTVRIPNLIGSVQGDPAPKPTTVDGKRAFVSAFQIVLTFNRKTSVDWGVGGIGGKVSYEAGESCQISVVLVFTGAGVRDNTANPCAVFTPGRIVMFDVSRPVYRAGDNVAYSVTGAPPNSPIYWSSTLNGVSTGEDLAFYGHYTDANGNFSAPSGPWAESASGEWVKTVHIGQFYDRIGFTVQSAVNPRVAVTTDMSVYRVGDDITYTVIGPPNSPIYWSSTLNGASTGEADSFYGQYTDASGLFAARTGPWQAGMTGQWTKSARVGGQTSVVAFTVQ